MATSSDGLWLGRHGGAVAQRLQDAFHLPALSTSVAEARKRVLARLGDWGARDELRDDAQLVVSELFTNAVRHTSSEKVRCELRVYPDRLRVEVADQGCGLAALRACEGSWEQEGGRGLMLVEALSDSWGVRPREGGRGRAVWAYLPTAGLPM
ncbi:ATP-binding protein [Streptomyces zagrosensis]|uniref:Anti-sigma regulatory factor (Ser/Thr protein kinase) n=1 Tax=Streptomyces zagrosensis TaxID=1042984 RepID=A0A7W9QBC9_9ACTN|nr:ATP-binding protein [Streptomyces zagrosensis]MBB5936643.1 anti-sigma regulatory factor (Ser/Thr protein kinase) [Streptomyces zagrosensis]